MPQFRWRGVTRDGAWRFGRSSAISAERLVERMFQRGIAVTKVTPVRIYYLWYRVPTSMQVQSLETVALLVESGMPLHEACLVTSETVEYPVLQECWVNLADGVERGVGIAEQAQLLKIFGPFITHLLAIGYQAGNFASMARILAEYARSLHELKGKLKSALAMPLITLLFVFGLLWLIFAFLVPSLTTLFSQFNAEIPSSTQCLLTLSATVLSPWFFIALLTFILLCIAAVYGFKQHGWGSRVLLKVPLVGSLYAQWQRMLLVQALSALLQGGMSLVEALQAVAELIPSTMLRLYAFNLLYTVSGGVTLSDALAIADTSLATPLMIAMVRVGQESNKMPAVLNTFAERESAEFIARLHRLTIIIQPTLIILLGFVVLAIISAIYMPLINIAQVVQ